MIHSPMKDLLMFSELEVKKQQEELSLPWNFQILPPLLSFLNLGKKFIATETFWKQEADIQGITTIFWFK